MPWWIEGDTLNMLTVYPRLWGYKWKKLLCQHCTVSYELPIYICSYHLYLSFFMWAIMANNAGNINECFFFINVFIASRSIYTISSLTWWMLHLCCMKFKFGSKVQVPMFKTHCWWFACTFFYCLMMLAGPCLLTAKVWFLSVLSSADIVPSNYNADPIALFVYNYTWNTQPQYASTM